jgi:hypothetical protein
MAAALKVADGPPGEAGRSVGVRQGSVCAQLYTSCGKYAGFQSINALERRHIVLGSLRFDLIGAGYGLQVAEAGNGRQGQRSKRVKAVEKSIIIL